MALKSFQELYSLDISEHLIERKVVQGGKDKILKYLSWEACLRLLYENGAEKIYWPFMANTLGYPAFFDPRGQNPFVRVALRIDDDEPVMFDYPVIDGIFVEKEPSQLAIHIAQQRCFVKAVAIGTGLGLKLWEKEAEEPATSNDTSGVDLMKPLSDAIKKSGSPRVVYEKLGLSEAMFIKITEKGTPDERAVIKRGLEAILDDLYDGPF